MKKIRFSIIIANFNGEKFLPDCLSSVFKTIGSNYEVIIVEDGSTDGSLKIISKFQQKYHLQLVQNKENSGLVRSRNAAIGKAAGDILVFLDNDTKVDKHWLKGLEKVFSADQTIGAAQCKIFDFKKKDIIQEIGMKLIPYTGFGMPVGRGEKDSGQFDNPVEIVALGAALAVRKDLAERIGGFDQKLFHYTDDLDFSWRVWVTGFRVVLAPHSWVYHYTKVHNLTYKVYFHLSKNSLRMILKNYEIFNMLKFLPLSLALNIIGGLYVLFSRGSLSGVAGVTFGIIWNMLNFQDTLKERSKIQSLKKTADQDILNKIMVSNNIFKFAKLYFKTAETSVALMK